MGRVAVKQIVVEQIAMVELTAAKRDCLGANHCSKELLVKLVGVWESVCGCDWSTGKLVNAL